MPTRQDGVEEPRGVQSSFQSQVQSLCNVIREKGNPSLDQIGNFLLLDTRDIIDATIVKTVRTVKALSNKKFQEFCTTKLNEQKLDVTRETRCSSLIVLRFRRDNQRFDENNINKDQLFPVAHLYISCQVSKMT